MSDKYGDKLSDMLSYYSKLGLRDITCQEEKEFLEKLIIDKT